jgi:hypothetical protein
MFMVTRRTWLEGWNLGLAAAAKTTMNSRMLRNAQLQSIRKNMLEAGMVQPTGGRLGSIANPISSGGGGGGEGGGGVGRVRGLGGGLEGKGAGGDRGGGVWGDLVRRAKVTMQST